MENFYNTFLGGINQFLLLVNWAFVACFIIWVVLLFGMNQRTKIKFEKLKFMPKGVYVFVLGIVLAILWAYFFRVTDREGISQLFFGITVGMTIYKFGINKLVEKVLFKKKQ